MANHKQLIGAAFSKCPPDMRQAGSSAAGVLSDVIFDSTNRQNMPEVNEKLQNSLLEFVESIAEEFYAPNGETAKEAAKASQAILEAKAMAAKAVSGSPDTADAADSAAGAATT